MKIQEIIGTLIEQSPRLGMFSMPELLHFIRSRDFNGIAAAIQSDREFYLAIVGSELEGAILVDDKGTLYGDKAMMLLDDCEVFELYEVSRDLVEAAAMGCRILDKDRIHKSDMDRIPEIGIKSQGLGVLSITILRNGVPENGLRVSIRSGTQMIGNDITTQDGTVGFRIPYGRYDCIIQDRAMRIYATPFTFDTAHPRITLQI